jgi:hypothetical protein
MAAFASPVKIEWPSEWRIPFIFSSPHSGRDYPEEFIESTKLEFTKLRQSEDFLVDELFACAPDYGAPLLSANFPRAYCDANREAFELDPHMYKTPLPDYVMTVSPRLASGIGTIPKVVGAGQEIYAGKLDFEDARQRINECYFPYHHALRQLLEEGRKKLGISICWIAIPCPRQMYPKAGHFSGHPIKDRTLFLATGTVHPAHQDSLRKLSPGLKTMVIISVRTHPTQVAISQPIMGTLKRTSMPCR